MTGSSSFEFDRHLVRQIQLARERHAYLHVYEGQKHQSWQHCPAFSKSPTLGRHRCVKLKLCTCGYSVELHLYRRRQPRFSSPVPSTTCSFRQPTRGLHNALHNAGTDNLAFHFYNLFFSTANKCFCITSTKAPQTAPTTKTCEKKKQKTNKNYKSSRLTCPLYCTTSRFFPSSRPPPLLTPYFVLFPQRSS